MKVLDNYNIIKDRYILLTIHRNYNTNKETIKDILINVGSIDMDIILPIHPRTLKVIEDNNIEIPNNVMIIKPVRYSTMIILQRNLYLIITDSGGIQQEAYHLNKYCLTLRPETEWIDTIEDKANRLCKPNMINKMIDQMKNKIWIRETVYYNKDCSNEIIKIILSDYNI
jgi:UDP-N-acetylglucosamine 2-epimerase